MIRAVFLALLVLMPLGCSDKQPAVDTSSIQGEWEMAVDQAQAIEPECRSARVTIGKDTVTSQSGKLEIVAGYRAERTGKGLRLHLSSVSHNGGSNCQGRPADYVMAHFVYQMDVAVVDGRLRLYDPVPNAEGYMVLLRVDSEGDQPPPKSKGAT